MTILYAACGEGCNGMQKFQRLGVVYEEFFYIVNGEGYDKIQVAFGNALLSFVLNMTQKLKLEVTKLKNKMEIVEHVLVVFVKNGKCFNIMLDMLNLICKKKKLNVKIQLCMFENNKRSDLSYN